VLYSLISHQLCSRYTTTRPATIWCPSLCCLSLSTYTDVKVLPHYGRGSAAYSWSEEWPSQLKTSSANSPPGPSMWWGRFGCQWRGCLFCSCTLLLRADIQPTIYYTAWCRTETNLFMLNSLCSWNSSIKRDWKGVIHTRIHTCSLQITDSDVEKVTHVVRND
jgi:hypothetical protein